MNISKYPKPDKRVPTHGEWDALEDFGNDNRVQDSADILVTDSPSGGKALILANGGGGGGGSAAGQQPWAVIPGVTAGTVRVSRNSSLMTDFETAVSITDIELDFTMELGDLLYLHITYGGGFTVELTSGAPWDVYTRPYDYTGAGTLVDPYVLTDGYFLVGFAVDPTDTDYDGLPGPTITLEDDSQIKVVRCCYTPLVMNYVNPGGGFVFLYPVPHIRPGPPPPP